MSQHTVKVNIHAKQERGQHGPSWPNKLGPDKGFIIWDKENQNNTILPARMANHDHGAKLYKYDNFS